MTIDEKVAEAVKFFWETRSAQAQKQKSAGKSDQGARGAATGGSQLNGFVRLISDELIESGIPKNSIFFKGNSAGKGVELPGFFRPTKEWDLLVVVDGVLFAAIEFKSQIGPSFGNNFNNRTEEALGSSTDLWTSYREGAFKGSSKPWLGYWMLLEEAPGSTKPVSVKESHFKVFPEFKKSSYANRYELFCLKLVRERLYDSACLILSDAEHGIQGIYKEPNPNEIGIKPFLTSLAGKALAYSKMKNE